MTPVNFSLDVLGYQLKTLLIAFHFFLPLKQNVKDELYNLKIQLNIFQTNEKVLNLL